MDRLIISEENAMDAFLEWRIQVNNGESHFDIHLPKSDVQKFRTMLKRNGYKYVDAGNATLIEISTQ